MIDTETGIDWVRAEKFLRAFVTEGGSLSLEDAELAGIAAGYPPGSWGGFLTGDGALERVGVSTIRMTARGWHDYAHAVGNLLGRKEA
jgi:hypothetical protein